MGKELYIHVGTPKTGTSAIQKYFERNKDILLDEGIRYDSWYDSKNILSVLKQNNSDKEKALDILSLFGTNNVMIISCEAFWLHFRNSNLYSELAKKGGVEVKVIIYLRNQIEYIDSMIEQKIKDGLFTLRPSEIFKNKGTSYDDNWFELICDSAYYYKYIKKIQKQVGKENIYVLEYKKSVNIKDQIKDIIGIKSLLIDENERVNESLDDSLSYLKTQINRKLPSDFSEYDIRTYFLNEQISVLKKKNNTRKKVNFSEDEENFLLEKYRKDNDLLKREFGMDLLSRICLDKQEESFNYNECLNDAVDLIVELLKEKKKMAQEKWCLLQQIK